MCGKSDDKRPEAAGKVTEDAERKAYRDSLHEHGKVQTEKGPLRPGVTHTLQKRPDAAPEERPVLVRRRFTAV